MDDFSIHSGIQSTQLSLSFYHYKICISYYHTIMRRVECSINMRFLVLWTTFRSPLVPFYIFYSFTQLFENVVNPLSCICHGDHRASL